MLRIFSPFYKGILLVLPLFFCFSSISWAQQFSGEWIAIGDTSQRAGKKFFTLSGTLYFTDTGEPAPYAALSTDRINFQSYSDDKGHYKLVLPSGNHYLRVQYLGWDGVVAKLMLFEDGVLDVEINPQAFLMEEVLVTAEGSDRNVRQAAMGIEQLRIDQVRLMPAFMGEVDVIKTLELLPGVSSAGEGSGGFNVRGGRVDQNLMLQDGAPLFNPTHVLGFFSAFNPDVVDNFTLYKGHVPARFGGRAASVLEVETREGDMEQFRLQGGIGLVTTRLAAEGPLVKDKSSFLIGGRVAYSDWLLGLATNPDVRGSKANFYDVNAKFTQKLGTNHRLSFALYQSQDRFRVGNEFGFNWRNQQANLQWQGLLGDRFLGKTRVAYGTYRSELLEPEGAGAFSINNTMRYLQVKPELLFSMNKSLNIRLGGEAMMYFPMDESLAPYGDQSGVIAMSVDKQQGREWAGFLDAEIKLGTRWAIAAGLRFSAYQQVGPFDVFSYKEGATRTPESITDTVSYGVGETISSYAGWEPRLSVRFKLGEHNALKASYNRMRQYIHLVSNTTTPTPVDIWQVSNTYLPPQIADNFSFGYFHNFGHNRWETSLELFYRYFQNLVEYKDFAELLLNPHLETELLSGIGRAYGGEASIRLVEGPWTGWLAYTYSRTLLKVNGVFPDEIINGGDWYPANYDQPHTVSLVATRRIQKRGAISTTFIYRTGRPYSAITASYDLGNTTVPQYSQRNAYRLPAYIRLDVSFTIGSIVKKWEDSLTFSVYNLLARKNIYSIFYRREDPNRVPKPYRLSVLGTIFPSLTYNFSF